MANEEDESRRRRREREDAADAITLEKKTALNKEATDPRAGLPENKIVELLNRAELLMVQLNVAYNQYAAGAEKFAPNERRNQLNKIIQTLQMTTKPTMALTYRQETLHSKFISSSTRWDKVLKSKELGKKVV